MYLRILLAAAAVALLVGAAPVIGDTVASADRLAPTGDGIDRAALDPRIEPCEDFYRHACGGFIARHPASADRPAISLAQEQFNATLKTGLDRLMREAAPPGSELARLQRFYGACRNGDGADGDIVGRWLARIDAVDDLDGVRRMTRDLARIGVNAFVSYGGRPDRTDAGRYRGEIHSGTLWADEAAVAAAFVAAGESPERAARDAAAVAELTDELRPHRVDRWDASVAEHPRLPADVAAQAPVFGWTAYLAMAGAAPDRPLNLTSPAYLAALDRALAEHPPAELRAYLKWAFLFSLRGELPTPYSRAFADLPANFRPETRDAALRCSHATLRAMGVEFSRQYAERILGVAARDAARELSERVRAEIIESIAEDRFLSAEARRRTADKLRRTDLKIGFPDEWPAVGDYALHRDRFLDNVLAARRFEQAREWRRATEPRSRTAWEMKVDPWVGEGMAAARLVLPNGFPDAFSNSLIMTAAFLSEPRFARAAAPELNYATYGTVFAHEFVHVAQLHMFGPDGGDEELWSAADIESADAAGQCVIDQADAYRALPDLALPGRDMFDENVADYGGVRLAYQALEKRLGDGIDRIDASGTSAAQRFFYRFAQSQCTSLTDDELRKSVANDGHAPPAFRVNAPLTNLPAFRRAFACPATAAMVRPPAGQCRVW